LSPVTPREKRSNSGSIGPEKPGPSSLTSKANLPPSTFPLTRVVAFFGPVMVLWFGVIGILGLLQIARVPAVLEARRSTSTAVAFAVPSKGGSRSGL